jgi:uncharacterized protein YbaR (Trm112 family)
LSKLQERVRNRARATAQKQSFVLDFAQIISINMNNSETKVCQNCKVSFTIDASDFNFYEKMKVPPPTFCPECRMFRRLIWRNERIFFRRPDSLTGKEIFSGFPSQIKAKVYDVEYWKSDAWDAMNYGREYDFSKPFFEQFYELLYAVPWPSRAIQFLTNSDYSNQADYLKNTYLVHNAGYVENSAYVVRANHIKDSLDFLDGTRAELAYDSTLIADGFKIFYSLDCAECNDVWLSKDLQGCSNCIGCAGLRRKNYCIFNKQYSKEDYAKELEELKLNTHSGLESARKKVYQIWQKTPVKFYHGKQLVNCVADNAMYNKNCKECWDVSEGQDLKFCQMVVDDVTNSYDYSIWGTKVSKIYECVTCGDQVENLKFCFDCWPGSKDLEYCVHCRSSSDLFGCIGLKKKQYCILNKQYTKGEYEELIVRIKDQMQKMPFIDSRDRVYRYGEYFPQGFSPFAYNETQLQDLFPKNKEQVEKLGFFWREQPEKKFDIMVKASDLPDSIDEIGEDIMGQIISCDNCGKAYKIIDMELKFLKHLRLPLPRLCIECRFHARNKFINPPVFYNRKCVKCNVQIRTTYAPDRPEIVYCEACYNQEVA